MTNTVVYEDALIRVEHPSKGVVDGHLIISPIQPVDTFAQADNELLMRIGFAANLVASVLFETLGVQGTNLVMNERPVRCDVLARKEGDAWKSHWAGKPANPEELGVLREKISFNIPLDEEQQETPVQTQRAVKQEAVVSREEVDEKKLRDEEEEENYLVRQLYRVP